MGHILLIILSSIIVLTSCAPIKKPPPYQPPPVDDRKIPDFERIEGKKQRVIASWYGKDFHGKPTASGEAFNMYAMTCAHREFPFGTMLYVTNPRNQKTVQCTINDRGPFIQGRDLDLSYGSAREIEILGMGVAPVDIEVFGRDNSYVKTVTGQITTGIMTIQIGSFREESNALRLKAGLDFKYKDVYITEVIIKGVKYYRVRLGSFRDPKEIKSLARQLAQEGYDTLITTY
ncbi:MAG TPA: septal ring lytic transglycosylase RlpA family protein [Nitrospirae bacterium]|nr:septal ring lytic transglycosylase RlpA family protein [Nitrospirota bacterium]